MSRPRRALPLRVLLSLFAATTVVYVTIVAAQLIRTIVPLAQDLRGRSRDLLDDHDRVSASLVALHEARRQLARLAPPLVPGAEPCPTATGCATRCWPCSTAAPPRGPASTARTSRSRCACCSPTQSVRRRRLR